jgi:hypothetical protein
MGSVPILFHLGLNGEARSCLIKPGYLRQVQNISFAKEGTQRLRPSFGKMNTNQLAAFNSVKAFKSSLFATTLANLYGNLGSGNLIDLTSVLAGAWSWSIYKDFCFGANGQSFIMADSNLNVFNPIIPNPVSPVSGVASGTGTINGTYGLYVSFLITFPNGQVYETGLSPVSGDVTASDASQIEWEGIPICSYASLQGAAPTITRNLYRGPGSQNATIANIYFVGNIPDNTTTTFTDINTDTDLAANFVCFVDLYVPPPIPKLLAFHYGRMYIIAPTHSWRLWYTEPASASEVTNTEITDAAFQNENLIPIATTIDNWDDMRTSGFDEVDPQALVSWGINLYIALKNTWIRKQGEDPATWGYKKTYARMGIGAPSSVAISSKPLGIIGVTNPEFGQPGIAVFTGQESQLISSPKLDFIFEHDLDISKIANCQGVMSGDYYLLIYPSLDGTMKFLALDMRRYPDVRTAYWTNLNAQSIDSSSQGTNIFIGGSDGYVRTPIAGESMAVLLETNDLSGNPEKNETNKIKTFKNFKYALKGTVQVQFYIDDILAQWPDGTTEMTLTGTGETLQWIQSLPQDWQGYRIRLMLTGTNLTEVEIYSPWSIDLDATES